MKLFQTSDSTPTAPENELWQHNSLNEDVPNNRDSTSATPENELRQSFIVTGTIRTNASPKMDRRNFANTAWSVAIGRVGKKLWCGERTTLKWCVKACYLFRLREPHKVRTQHTFVPKMVLFFIVFVRTVYFSPKWALTALICRGCVSNENIPENGQDGKTSQP